MLITDVSPQPSWDLVADYQLVTQYPFMQHALVAGTCVAIVAGIVGYFMVIRGQIFAGHSLATVGFAGATGATLIGFSAVVGLFIATILAAAGIYTLGLGARQTRQNDVAVGATLTAALALGFLFIVLSPLPYAGSVYSILFGSPLTINSDDVGLIIGVTLICSSIMLAIARPLLFASLDPEAAAAHGVPVQALGAGYLFLLALVVAVSVQIIGVLLIFALLVTPAAIANTLTTRPAVAVMLAVVFGVLFTWVGLTFAYFTLYPAGFFITTVAFGTYILARLAHQYAGIQPVPPSFPPVMPLHQNENI